MTSSFIPTGFSEPRVESAGISIPQKDFSVSAQNPISIPSKLGTIRTSFYGSGKQTIIHIQDAHSVPDAQKSIEKIIGKIYQDYGVSLAALEGAEGSLDPLLFSAHPDKTKIRKVFDRYLESGELSGAAVASVFLPKMKFLGVEDWKTYETGIHAFIQALSAQPALEKEWQRKQKELDRKKEKIYPQKALELDHAWKNWQKDSSALYPLLNVLEKTDSKKFKRFTHLVSILRMIRDEEKGRNTPKQILEKVQRMQGEEFFSELKAVVEFHKEHLLITPEQKTLKTQDHHLELRMKLVRFELSFEEWTELKKIENRGWMLEALTSNFKLLNSHIEFYNNAEVRNTILLEKTLKAMKDQNTNAAILVTGGFHSEYLNTELRKRGISLIEITPAMASLPKENHYADFMQGKVSWKKYFEIKNGSIDLYDAFARAARDQLVVSRESSVFSYPRPTTQDPRLLKDWRDNILRTLAKSGQIEKASNYTRYLDEVISNNHNSEFLKNLRREWETKIDQFVEKLDHLKQTNALNVNALESLFKSPANIPYTAVASLVPGNRFAVNSPAFRSEVRSKKNGSTKNGGNGDDWIEEAMRSGNNGEASKRAGNANSRVDLDLSTNRSVRFYPAPAGNGSSKPEFVVANQTHFPNGEPIVVPENKLPPRVNEAYVSGHRVQIGNLGNAFEDRHRFYMRYVVAHILQLANKIFYEAASEEEGGKRVKVESAISDDDLKSFLKLLNFDEASQRYRDTAIVFLNKSERARPMTANGLIEAANAKKSLNPVQREHALRILKWMLVNIPPMIVKDTTLGMDETLLRAENPQAFLAKRIEAWRGLAMGWSYTYVYAPHVGVGISPNGDYYSLLPHWVYSQFFKWKNRFQSADDQSYFLAQRSIQLSFPVEAKRGSPETIKVILTKPYINIEGTEQKEVSLFILKKPVEQAIQAATYAQFRDEVDRDETLSFYRLSQPERVRRLLVLAGEGKLLFNLEYLLDVNELDVFLSHVAVNDYERVYLQDRLSQQMQYFSDTDLEERRVTSEVKGAAVTAAARDGSIYAAIDNPVTLEFYPFGVDEAEREKILEKLKMRPTYLAAGDLNHQITLLGPAANVSSLVKIDERYFRTFMKALDDCPSAKAILESQHQAEVAQAGIKVKSFETVFSGLTNNTQPYTHDERERIATFSARISDHFVSVHFVKTDVFPEEALNGDNIALEMDLAIANLRPNVLGFRWIPAYMKFSDGASIEKETAAKFSLTPAYTLMALGFEPYFMRERAVSFLVDYLPMGVELLVNQFGYQMPNPLFLTLGKHPHPVNIYVLKKPFSQVFSGNFDLRKLDQGWESFRDSFETDQELLKSLEWTLATPIEEREKRLGALLKLAAENRLLIHEDFVLRPQGWDRFTHAVTEWPRIRGGFSGADIELEKMFLEQMRREIPVLNGSETLPDSAARIEGPSESQRQSIHTFFSLLDLADLRPLSYEGMPELVRRVESWGKLASVEPFFQVLPVLAGTFFSVNPDGSCCQVQEANFLQVMTAMTDAINKSAKRPEGKSGAQDFVDWIVQTGNELQGISPESKGGKAFLVQTARFAVRALDLTRTNRLGNLNDVLRLMTTVKGYDAQTVGRALNFQTGEQAHALAESVYELAQSDLGGQAHSWESVWRKNLPKSDFDELVTPAKQAQPVRLATTNESMLWDLQADALMKPLLPHLPKVVARVTQMETAAIAESVNLDKPQSFLDALNALEPKYEALERIGIDPAQTSAVKLSIPQGRPKWSDWESRNDPPIERSAEPNNYLRQIAEKIVSLRNLRSAIQAFQDSNWAQVSALLQSETQEGKTFHAQAKMLVEQAEARQKQQDADVLQIVQAEIAGLTDSIQKPPVPGGDENPTALHDWYQGLMGKLAALEEGLSARSELRHDLKGLSESQRAELLQRVQAAKRELQIVYEKTQMNQKLDQIENAFEAEVDRDEAVSLDRINTLMQEAASLESSFTSEGPHRAKIKRRLEIWQGAIRDFRKIRFFRIFDRWLKATIKISGTLRNGDITATPAQINDFIRLIDQLRNEQGAQAVLDRALASQREVYSKNTELKGDSAFTWNDFLALLAKEPKAVKSTDKYQVYYLISSLLNVFMAVDKETVQSPLMEDGKSVPAELKDPDLLTHKYFDQWVQYRLGFNTTHINRGEAGMAYFKEQPTQTPLQRGFPNLAAHLAAENLGYEFLYRDGNDLAYLIAQGQVQSAEWVEPYPGLDSPPTLKVTFKKDVGELDETYKGKEMFFFIRKASAPAYRARKRNYADLKADFMSEPAENLPRSSGLMSSSELARLEKQLIQLAREKRLLTKGLYWVTRESLADFLELTGLDEESVNEVQIAKQEQELQVKIKLLKLSGERKGREVEARLAALDPIIAEDDLIKNLISQFPLRNRKPDELGEIRKRVAALKPIQALVTAHPDLGRVFIAESNGKCCSLSVEEVGAIATEIAKANKTGAVASLLESQSGAAIRAAIDFILRALPLPRRFNLTVARLREIEGAAFGNEEFGSTLNLSRPSGVRNLVLAMTSKSLTVRGLSLDSTLPAFGLTHQKLATAENDDPVWALHSDLILSGVLPALRTHLQTHQADLALKLETGSFEETKQVVTQLQTARDLYVGLGISEEGLTALQAPYQAPTFQLNQWRADLYPSVAPQADLFRDPLALQARFDRENQILQNISGARENLDQNNFAEATQLLNLDSGENTPWQNVVASLSTQVATKEKEWNQALDETTRLVSEFESGSFTTSAALTEASENVTRSLDKASGLSIDVGELRTRHQSALTAHQKALEKREQEEKVSDLKDKLAAVAKSVPENDDDLTAVSTQIQALGDIPGVPELNGELDRIKSRRRVMRVWTVFQNAEVTIATNVDTDSISVYSALTAHAERCPEDFSVPSSEEITKAVEQKKDKQKKLKATQKAEEALTQFENQNFEVEAEVEEAGRIVEMAISSAEDLGAEIESLKTRIQTIKESKVKAIREKTEQAVKKRREWVGSVVEIIPAVARNILVRTNGRSSDPSAKAQYATRIRNLIAQADQFQTGEPVENEAKAKVRIVELQSILNEYDPLKAPQPAFPSPPAASYQVSSLMTVSTGTPPTPTAATPADPIQALETALAGLIAANSGVLKEAIKAMEAQIEALRNPSTVTPPAAIQPQSEILLLPPASVAPPEPARNPLHTQENSVRETLDGFKRGEYKDLQSVATAAKNVQTAIEVLKIAGGGTSKSWEDELGKAVKEKEEAIAISWAREFQTRVNEGVHRGMISTNEAIRQKILEFPAQAGPYRKFKGLPQVAAALGIIDRLVNLVEAYQLSVRSTETRARIKQENAASRSESPNQRKGSAEKKGGDSFQPRRQPSHRPAAKHSDYKRKKTKEPFEASLGSRPLKGQLESALKSGTDVMFVYDLTQQLVRQYAESRENQDSTPPIITQAFDFLEQHRAEVADYLAAIDLQREQEELAATDSQGEGETGEYAAGTEEPAAENPDEGDFNGNDGSRAELRSEVRRDLAAEAGDIETNIIKASYPGTFAEFHEQAKKVLEFARQVASASPETLAHFRSTAIQAFQKISSGLRHKWYPIDPNSPRKLWLEEEPEIYQWWHRFVSEATDLNAQQNLQSLLIERVEHLSSLHFYEETIRVLAEVTLQPNNVDYKIKIRDLLQSSPKASNILADALEKVGRSLEGLGLLVRGEVDNQGNFSFSQAFEVADKEQKLKARIIIAKLMARIGFDRKGVRVLAEKPKVVEGVKVDAVRSEFDGDNFIIKAGYTLAELMSFNANPERGLSVLRFAPRMNDRNTRLKPGFEINVRARLTAAQIAMSFGWDVQATSYLDIKIRSVKKNYNKASLLIEQAKLNHLKFDHFPRAFEELVVKGGVGGNVSEITERYRDYPEVHRAVAEILFRQGNDGQGRRILEQAIKRFPLNVYLRNDLKDPLRRKAIEREISLAREKIKKKDFSQAANHLKRVWQLDPHYRFDARDFGGREKEYILSAHRIVLKKLKQVQSEPAFRSEIRNVHHARSHQALYTELLPRVLGLKEEDSIEPRFIEQLRDEVQSGGTARVRSELRLVLDRDFVRLTEFSILGIYEEQTRFEASHRDYQSRFSRTLQDSARRLIAKIEQSENGNFSFAVPFSRNQDVQNWIRNIFEAASKRAQSESKGSIRFNLGLIMDPDDIVAKQFANTLKALEVSDQVSVRILGEREYSEMNQFLNLHANALLLSDENNLVRQIARKKQLVLSPQLPVEASFPLFAKMVEESFNVSEIDQAFINEMARRFSSMIQYSKDGYAMILEAAREIIFQAEVSRRISTNA